MIRFWGKAPDPYYANPRRLAELLASERDYHLVDVRTAGEFVDGHIRGAVHAPHLEIGDRPPTEDRSALIVLYCHSGGRSEAAKRTLRTIGYENVYNFGGIVHWSGELTRGTE